MDKKSRVWLVVLTFLLIVVLGMCVVFKLKMDDANERYDDAMADALRNDEMVCENNDVDRKAEIDESQEEPSETKAVDETEVIEKLEATEENNTSITTEELNEPDVAETVPMKYDEENAEADDVTDAVEGKIEEYTPEQIAAMREELEASRAREAELEAEVELLQTEVDLYRSDDASKMNEQTADISGEAETMYTEESLEIEEPAPAGDTDLAYELDSAIAEKEVLSVELEAVKAENEALSEELDVAMAENESLSSKLETTKTENERLNCELEAAHSENAVLSSELGEATIANDELDDQLKDALADNERLAGELDVANAHIALMDSQLRAYRGNAPYGLADVVYVASDGVSAEYTYVCKASEGNISVCELSINDEVIYMSDEMLFGDSIEGFVLKESLEAGSHEAILTVVTYRQDGSIASRITMPVMVMVHK